MTRTAARSVALSLAFMLLATSLVGIIPSASADETIPPVAPAPDRQDVIDSVLRALDWFAERQSFDGGWSSSVGITGFVLMCYANAGYDHTNRTVANGLQFLRNFYDPVTRTLANSPFHTYDTSLSLMAMSAIGDPRDHDMIVNMTEFLESFQFTDHQWYNMTKDWYWGGWPNYAGIPDMSNSQFALLGLQCADLYNGGDLVDDVVWNRATDFIQVCQNWPDLNPLEWADNESLPSHGDGGFVYNGYRSRTPAGELVFESYGSITAAGLYSYLVTGNGPQQPEVMAARDWLDFEYNLEVNPKMVGKGLYYYLWTQARAFAMSTQDWVVDGSGKLHDWRPETASFFMGLQQNHGGWAGNPQIGWREEEPELASIYSLLSMQAGYLMVPDPELTIEVEGSESVSFIDQAGSELITDVTKGLTVTGSSLTCTDPEVFRKLWVSIDGTEGSQATVTATGTWGDGRSSVASKEVQLGREGASVHVSAGGFAGPFSIHLTGFDEGAKLQVGKSNLELVRGETEVLKVKVVETSTDSTLNNVMLLTYVDDVVADVEEQGVSVAKGSAGAVKLTISVGRDAVSDGTSRLVLTSATAPPVPITIKLVEPERADVPTIIYWLAIAILFILVIAFFALPRMSKRGQV